MSAWAVIQSVAHIASYPEYHMPHEVEGIPIYTTPFSISLPKAFRPFPSLTEISSTAWIKS